MKMKIAKGISAKLFDFQAEMGNYRFRPGKSFQDLIFLSSTDLSPAVKFKFPTRGTREDFLYNGTFHEAIGFILAVAQVFGIMPVGGIREKSPNKLKFRKFSIRFVLCIFFIVGLFWYEH